MRLVATRLAVLLIVAGPAGLRAQSPLVVDLRAGASIPVGSFKEEGRSGAEVGAGESFGVHFGLRRGSFGFVYLGFAQHRFRCRGAGCSDYSDMVATGWDVGLRLTLPAGPVRPWVRIGVVIDRVEDFEGLGAGGRRVSSLGLGGELGAGLALGPVGRIRFSPGVRYASLGANFPGDHSVRMRYLVADLGLVVDF